MLPNQSGYCTDSACMACTRFAASRIHFAAKIAAVLLIQRCWRRYQLSLRNSAEWAQRYHPLHKHFDRGHVVAKGSDSGTALTPISMLDAELELAANAAAIVDPDSGVLQARDEARSAQSVWVREQFGVMTIWMRDEASMVTQRHSDANMAQFFFKRGKPLAAVRCLEKALQKQPQNSSCVTMP